MQPKRGAIERKGDDTGKTFEVKVGEPWSSRTPNIIGYIDNLIELMGKQLVFWKDRTLKLCSALEAAKHENDEDWDFTLDISSILEVKQ